MASGLEDFDYARCLFFDDTSKVTSERLALGVIALGFPLQLPQYYPFICQIVQALKDLSLGIPQIDL